VSLSELTFPLVPRHRLLGLAFGSMHSARRGIGSDVAGSRPYRPGDDVHAIDWNASARLSSARGTDEFIVRERFAEDAPRVVIVVDRRPAMALFPPELPWLSKREALVAAAEMIAESAATARGLVGYLDFAEGEPFWRPPRSQGEARRIEESHLVYPSFRAPEDTLRLALDHLLQSRRALPPGTFVFVLSDFLAPPPPELWLRVLEQRWDIVPVVIQDPRWEQSFPDVGGLSIPVFDPATGTRGTLRLTRREARQRRAENEERLRGLLDVFLDLQLETIVLSSSDHEEILGSFFDWADQRRFLAGREWRRTA
jgi:uncharacterized protein (DUF58 family)